MKVTVVIIVSILALWVAMFFFRGFMSESGEAPGAVNDKLTKCPDKPNCVCSEISLANAAFVSPIELKSENTADAWLLLTMIINEQGGQIKIDAGDYLAATFTSAVFGFVDDLEARLDVEQGVIHLRSASRVGHSDFGVNRQRIELLKRRFSEKASALQ
jgi:uncharacterized protein (DUF1499 family)